MDQQTVPGTRVVIIGGGFGGLAVARRLRKAPVEITLIDRRNHHLFQPLLYQVATGELSPADIASPLRRLLKNQKNSRVVLGEVVDIDPAKHQVILNDKRRIVYDKLIVAAGARSTYFGSDQWREFAPTLKTIEDAVEIRRRILDAFETAERLSDAEAIRACLTFVVIGGGPTGVEMAGAVAEIARQTFNRGFTIDAAGARIVLIQSGDRILPSYHPNLSMRAATMLERMGVEVYTGWRVVNISPDGVTITNGSDEPKFVATRTPLWNVGVQASPLGKVLERVAGAQLDRGGRVMVSSDCSVPGHPDIFVIGDLAHFPDGDGKSLPGVAQVAIQQGKYVARLIRRELDGKQVQPFRYFDRGSLATIGRGAAIAEIRRLRVSGWLAWKIWLFIHLTYLLDFENRVLVMIQWLWNFFTGERSALLMIYSEQPVRPAANAKYATDTGTWPVVR